MKYAMVVAESFALGPAYIISYLRSQGHDVRLFFDPLQHSVGGTKSNFLSRVFSVESYNIKKIKEFNPDACLFSCTTAHYIWALRMAKKVKEAVGCKIIFGGVHPTTVPEVVRENDFIDDVCVGDGIKYFGGEFNPDKIFPARVDFYRELPIKDIAQPYIMTSFGCPFRCTYCLPPDKKLKLPRRSVDGCIEELRWLKDHGAERVAIWDDVFTLNRVWLCSFLKKYKKEIDLPFRCVTHVKFVDDDLMRLLKEAGCYMIAIGIQTGSEWLRKEVLNRHETNLEFIEACRLVKKHGIKLLIDHIFDIPFSIDITNAQSYHLYKHVKPDMVNCFELVYFPKAEIINTAIDCGIFTRQDVPRIERGEFPMYASGVNNIIANKDPWVRKILSVPLKGRFWHRLPESFIKIALYTKIYLEIKKDCIPITIIQNHLYYKLRRLTKW